MTIDLTHPISVNLPVYPGDPPVSISEVLNIKQHGCLLHEITTGTHIGTHIDAASHMIEGGKNIDEYPPERFVCAAVCLDVKTGFSALDVDLIPEGIQAVLFHTGFDKFYYEPKYWADYPVMDDDVIDALINKGVSLIGLDCASPDSDEKFPVHIKLLSADILIVENLTGLEQLVGKDNIEFHAMPLRLSLDGSPVRAFAKF
jgi:arylformamidase